MLSSNAYVTCPNLSNEQDLVKAVNSIKTVGNIHSLDIVSSNFNYIPHDVFVGVQFKELEIRSTTLMALTDTDVAFQGLEGHLEILMMVDCTFMNEWKWSIFNHLRRLDIIHGDLRSIGGEEDVEFNTTSVNDINFSDNRISYVHSLAFSNFRDLYMLILRGNEITRMSRTMFPDPALEFKRLDLSYNRIQEFPDDMFTNMPQLQYLNLAFNEILVLKENTFHHIWEHLDHLDLLGNKLRCDCRLSWVLTRKHPRSVLVKCAEPWDLAGRNLVDLTPSDLWCY